MKTIQFRCFYRGVMYPVKEMQFDTDGSFSVSIIEMDLDGLGVRDVSPDSAHVEGIMQFCGLHDKNGTPIFEGDLIRVEMCECTGHDDEGNEIWIDCEGPVSFEDGAFIFYGHSAGTIPLSAYIENITVIGHIYEDHERQRF